MQAASLTIMSLVAVFTPQVMSVLAKKIMIQSDCNLVPNALNPLKTNIEALKIKKILGETP